MMAMSYTVTNGIPTCSFGPNHTITFCSQGTCTVTLIQSATSVFKEARLVRAFTVS